MTRDHPEMLAQDVTEIVKLIQENTIDVIIDGRWGVDALFGKQTRSHQDLDVAVKHQDVPQKCITPEWMVKFHTWYRPDKDDDHDVKLLCERYGIEIPVEYEEFVLNDRQL